MKKTLFTTYLLTISVLVVAQKGNKFIREGNEAYQERKFSDADLSYRKALNADESSFEGNFNLGNALYKQSRFQEAVAKFNSAAQLASQPGEKAMAYYNLGNALLKQDKYKEAIESYQNSLRLYPGDPHAMYNLSYAAQKLKEQQKGDQSQDKENQQNKDEKNESGKNDQQEKDGGNEGDKENKEKAEGNDEQDKNSSEDKGSQSQQDSDPTGKSGQAPKEVSISPEDARKLLEALQGEEKKVQAKVLERKGKGKKIKAEKEW